MTVQYWPCAQLSANTMANGKHPKDQRKLETDSLIYLIRKVVNKTNIGTWEDTTAVYNRLTGQTRSHDGVKSRYQLLEKDVKTRTAVEEEIKKGEWVKKKIIIEKLLRGAVNHVCQNNLEKKLG
jgi:hypothetical protein